MAHPAYNKLLSNPCLVLFLLCSKGGTVKHSALVAKRVELQLEKHDDLKSDFFFFFTVCLPWMDILLLLKLAVLYLKTLMVAPCGWNGSQENAMTAAQFVCLFVSLLNV